MAKRANPFIEDFVQQSKVHVGRKQFNNNEDRLKKVYDKTLQLLFKGAKKSSQDVTVNVDVVSHKRDGKKQLFIGKDGVLLHSGVEVPIKSPAVVQQCSCGSPAVEVRCGYCESPLCGPCQHCCLRCGRSYCSKCSVFGSESSEVCVSCYG